MKISASGPAGTLRTALLSGSTLLALIAPGIAGAQELAQPAPPATPAADSNVIVVTATKREQTLQEVPVAVTVTSVETLERAQIRDVKDLSSVVPSLRISQLQSSANTNFFIRGFGNGANNAGIEPSVGVFIDGVYRSRSAAQIGDFPDVQRIEVLRGPQSTLFGKNASAGVISIVTKEPQFTFGGNVEATYGNFDAVTLKGLVTGPVSESIAVSLAGGINKREGYVRDLGSGTRTNERDRWFARGQVLFEPTSDLKVRLIGDYSKIDENCCAVVNLQPSASTAALRALGGQVTTPAQRFDNIVFTNFPSTNDIENYGASGQIDYAMGPLNFTSITAYRKLNALTNQDSDFTSADLLGQNSQDLGIKTFTQELRLATDLDGPFNVLVGGYYFNEKIDQDNALRFGTQFRPYADLLIQGQSAGAFNLAAVEQVLGAALTGNPASYIGRFFANNQGTTENYKLKDESYSFFGQVDFEIVEGLTLTGGINYTKDKKRFATNVTSTDFFSSIDLSSATVQTNVANVLIAQSVGARLTPPQPAASPAQIGAFAGMNPQVFAAIQAGAAGSATQLRALRALQFLPQFVNLPNSVESGRVSDDDLSYTLRLAYDLQRNINVYLSYATGYKPPSVNLSRDSRPAATDRTAIQSAGLAQPNQVYGSRFAPGEDATVYEFGMKADWGLASFNLAVFKQSIKNFQSNIFTGTGFFLASAGKQSTFGIEFEGNVRPAEGLLLGLAMTYLDPKYDSFVGSAFGDASGQTPAGVPPISATISGEYDHELGNGDHVILRGDYHYESRFNPVEGLPGFIDTNPITGQVIPNPVTGAPGGLSGVIAARPYTVEVNDVNASLTYAMEMGLELSVWGRNLLDDRNISQIFDSPAQQRSISGYPSQPRTYGVAARFRF